jgi:hypothetical protein
MLGWHNLQVHLDFFFLKIWYQNNKTFMDSWWQQLIGINIAACFAVMYTKRAGRKELGNCNSHPTAWQCLFGNSGLDIRNYPPYSPYLGSIDFHLCGSMRDRNLKLTMNSNGVPWTGHTIRTKPFMLQLSVTCQDGWKNVLTFKRNELNMCVCTPTCCLGWAAISHLYTWSTRLV